MTYVPPMPPCQFSAASDTNQTTHVRVQNGLDGTAAILLVHVPGTGAIEWLWQPNVDGGNTTPDLTVNFGSATDYWIVAAWVSGDANGLYCTLANGGFSLWKQCGLGDGDANQQLTLGIEGDAVLLPFESACTSDVTALGAFSSDPVNIQIVNNLGDNVSILLLYADTGTNNRLAYCQNAMAMGEASPVLQTTFGTDVGASEYWLVQAAQVFTSGEGPAIGYAYVTGATSFESVTLHDSDANGTVVLTVTSSEVTFSKPSGSESLAMTRQQVRNVQTSG